MTSTSTFSAVVACLLGDGHPYGLLLRRKPYLAKLIARFSCDDAPQLPPEPDNSWVVDFIRKCRPFGMAPMTSGIGGPGKLAVWMKVLYYEPFEMIFEEGDESRMLYVIVKGGATTVFRGISLFTFKERQTFGEIGCLERAKRRAGTQAGPKGAQLLGLPLSALDDPLFDPQLMRDTYVYLGRRMTMTVLDKGFYDQMCVLIIQDGGCAPGYNVVTSFLVEHFERAGKRCFVAMEGFKSVVSGTTEDFGMLVFDPKVRDLLSSVSRVFDAAALREARGASFRTERYPEFKEPEKQKIAVENLVKRRVETLVCIGGNGTMQGACAFGAQLPQNVHTYFIPVTIDSDIYHTETIGQHTGVEQGAEKLRRYVADAYTHQRCYIIEMMGAEGGFHALESCIGAGAHYAALTETLSEKELTRIAVAISTRRSTVIAVSEGYARELRKSFKAQAKSWSNFIPFVSTSSRPGHKDLVSASSFLKYQLLKTGKLDPRKKVVCEPFSRDIRGAAPNNLDTFLSQQMAAKVVEMDQLGVSRVMPAVVSGEVSFIPFDEIRTYNGVKPEIAALADHL